MGCLPRVYLAQSSVPLGAWDSKLNSARGVEVTVEIGSSFDDQFKICRRKRVQNPYQKFSLHTRARSRSPQDSYIPKLKRRRMRKKLSFLRLTHIKRLEACHNQRVQHQLDCPCHSSWRQNSTIKHHSQRFPLPFSSTIKQPPT